MKMIASLVGIAALLICFVPLGSGLDCYVCFYSPLISNSSLIPQLSLIKQDPACVGPEVPEKYRQTCPASSNVCVKTTSSGNVMKTSVAATARLCAQSSTYQDGCLSMNGVKECIATCSTDMCNGSGFSSRQHSSITTILMLLSVLGSATLLEI